MRRIFFLLIALALVSAQGWAQNQPLRIFIRAGEKTHGPNQHDHPRFLKEWTELLNQRGAKTTGKLGFPSAQELENTDVLVMYAAEGGTITGEDRSNLEKFLKRGGGIVTIHDAACGSDPHWFKTVIGGAWEHKHSKWLEGEVGIYFINTEHPITRGFSNFDLKDEIYFDLHMMPEAKVLASSFHSVFVIAPQVWTYEKENYRSFVTLQGHEWSTFELPHFRALLLRGIAWAGKRENVDYLCSQEELNSLKYPVGGPTAPEKAAEKMNVHPEFNVSLVTSEPQVEKPMSLDWDAQGRLWVAETPEYPGGRRINPNDRPVAKWNLKNPGLANQEKENRPGKDRISYLEDTNGDGRMDKKTVFYDGLELVTSMVFYKDGVIVAQAPDILWIRDTDKDGKADKVETLYTGFGTMDTHAVINNFRRGMDGWVYGAVGYSAGEPRSSDGSKNFGRISAGIIRFKPDGTAVEQYASGNCNTWGFDFNWDGEAFFTTATCGEHFLHIVMPEKALARGSLPGTRAAQYIADHNKVVPSVKHTRPAYVQIDWVGAFTAAAGCCMYTGGAWPEKYNSMHFCSEPTVSLVHNDVIKPSGVTYIASKETGREEAEFVAASDLWFRPIHTRVGPEGALYVIDFYNQAAIHNDTRGPAHGAANAAVRPDRDHHFGRIWRYQHKEAKALPKANLTSNKPADWVQALTHANGQVRMTAHQLLIDHGVGNAIGDLEKLVMSGSVHAKIHALWVLSVTGKLKTDHLLAATRDKDAAVRKAALKVLAENDQANGDQGKKALMASLKDENARVRLNALIALATVDPSDDVAAAIVTAYPGLQNKHMESAAIGVASRDPLRFLKASFNAKEVADLSPFVAAVTRHIAVKQNADQAAALVQFLAAQETEKDALKIVALEALAATLKPDLAPDWNSDLQNALKTLLASKSWGLADATLPLIARWDRENNLTSSVRPVIAQLSAKLADNGLADAQRAQVAINLLGVRKMDSEIVPTVAQILGGNSSLALQKQIIEAMGNVQDPAIGNELVSAYSKIAPELREAAFAQIIKRSDWANALLDSIQQRKIELVTLGPASLHRLKTHADKGLGARATEVIEEIRGPEMKEKNALIAKLAPEVEKRGDLDKGHQMFTQNCANCHKYKGEGRDVAPDLTGMGAHGALDLLVHIVDPNRVVEPNFVTVTIETKDDLTYDGIVARENQNIVVLRNATGDFEIRQDNIKTRRSTGISLMPNGFEALGEEGLRDLLTYLIADENKYRILDLTSAFTADSTKGLFNSREAANETLRFARFGMVKAGEIPFEIVPPTKTSSGNNIIVLKGGNGYAKTMPQKVEINTNVKADKLHFLGGVGGWAYPCCGDNNHENLPVAKVTVHYASGQTEELILKNGVEFADYINKIEVPGSTELPGVVRYGQIRWFTKPLKTGGQIKQITIESYDNFVAPTFVSITAETSEGAHGQAATSASGSASSKSLTKVLIVGGGSSHDFKRWFNEEDVKTLKEGGLDPTYTDNTDIAERVKEFNVLYLNNNQPFKEKSSKEAIFNHVAEGKGLLLVHAALWYSWGDWPEYNTKLVGGGARSHDKFQEFEVSVIKDHPITAGLPKTFKITDELYHFKSDAHGSEKEVVMVGKEIATGKTYPVAWITQHDKAKIVCTTLGHDGQAHQHEAFKKLLVNSAKWVGGQD
ncbi:MAG: ThuA domain-containing protein [Verrucomicrobiota bacterium]|nr:ThuA domain-containing protein [Verrucomicrobiota bacterium]